MTIPKVPAFASAEYAGRLTSVQSALKASDMDGLLVFDPHNVNYLCGMDTENLFDYQCLIVPREGVPTLVLLDFELSRWENSATECLSAAFGSSDDPIAATWSTIRDCGLWDGRIGVESGSWLDVERHRRLIRGLVNARVVDGFGIVEKRRLVKSPAELEYMRRAAKLTWVGVTAGRNAIRAGAADHEIAAEVMHAMYTAGSETVCWGPIVAAGYRSGCAHSTFNGYRVQQGDAVFFEVTGQFRRYVAPLMRTSILGAASDEQQRVANAVRACLSEIQANARAGVRASDVAAVAKRALTPILEGMVFHYIFGYPIGIGYPGTWIEKLGFLIREDNDQILETGMAFHLPISIRKYGEYGINLSEAIVVGPDGSELLSEVPAELHMTGA